MDTTNIAVLLVSFLLVGSILSSLISYKVGAPLLLIFLAFGLLVGSDGLGIAFDNSEIAFLIGSVALAVILFDSGFQTEAKKCLFVLKPAFLLATIGVIMTALFVAPFAKYVLGLTWIESLFLGAMISSTDAAAVFFLLRINKVAVQEKTKSTLEVESSSNDPMAILLIVAITQLMKHPEQVSGMFDFSMIFISQLSIGILMGGACSALIIWAVNRLKLDSGVYPILVPAIALLVFALTNMLNGSGFLAVYVAGLLVGNAKVQGDSRLRGFQNGLSWLCQIIMFVMLGLFATPSQFPSIILPSIALGFGLTFIARPVAVFACLAFFKYTFKEKLFISFVGLRGSVSILLAIIPLVENIENARLFFNVVFLMVLFSLVTQGWLIAPLARFLKLLRDDKTISQHSEVEIPGLSGYYLVQYHIIPASPVLRGKRIPKWVRPLFVRRRGLHFFFQSPEIQEGDDVYFFAHSSRIPLLDDLFIKAEEGEDVHLLPVNLDTSIKNILDLYHLSLPERLSHIPVDEPIGKLFPHAFDEPQIGDRIGFGPIDIVISNAEDGKITAAAIDIRPFARHTQSHHSIVRHKIRQFLFGKGAH